MRNDFNLVFGSTPMRSERVYLYTAERSSSAKLHDEIRARDAQIETLTATVDTLCADLRAAKKRLRAIGAVSAIIANAASV